MDQTLIVSITGTDQPGITAGILHILSGASSEVLDMEQVVVRNRLTLEILIGIDERRSPLKDLLFFGWERGLDIDFEPVATVAGAGDEAGEGETNGAGKRAAVTIIGTRLGPETLAHVADAIADGGGNIDRIVRLSRYPVMSYELIVVGGEVGDLRSRLMRASSIHRVDIAVQPEGLARRAKRLVIIDMDSTLIQDEVIDLLAEVAGSGAEVRRITESAMAGETDFAESLHRRVATLAGLDAAGLQDVAERIRYTPGARTFARTLRRLGYQTAVVSGGFDIFAEQVRAHLGMDFAYANTLEIVDGRLSGRVVGDVIDGAAKARLLRETADRVGVAIEQTVAVGDGGNDLEMLSTAGLGIAFNAKPVVDAAADTTVKVPYLDAILFVLGISRAEIEIADKADGTFHVVPIPADESTE